MAQKIFTNQEDLPLKDKEMKILFLAGQYRADTTYKVYQNIKKAEKKAIELWEAGWIVICPHLNSQLFEHTMENAHDIVMPGYLKIVERCDTIYMMKGFEDSEGSKLELKAAKENGLEVIYESP